jgi:hypothetical protein
MDPALGLIRIGSFGSGSVKINRIRQLPLWSSELWTHLTEAYAFVNFLKISVILDIFQSMTYTQVFYRISCTGTQWAAKVLRVTIRRQIWGTSRWAGHVIFVCYESSRYFKQEKALKITHFVFPQIKYLKHNKLQYYFRALFSAATCTQFWAFWMKLFGSTN